jgi:hypothetical protein
MTTMQFIITLIILAMLAGAASAATYRHPERVLNAAPKTNSAVAANTTSRPPR